MPGRDHARPTAPHATAASATRILFLDATGQAYDEASSLGGPMGGIQACTAQLAQSLADAGCDVTVANGRSDTRRSAGVRWVPLAEAAICPADVVIADNDPAALNRASAALRQGALPVVWHHNHVKLRKTLSKGRFGPLWRWRPVGVFPGIGQARRCPRALPYAARTVIAHGIDPYILAAAGTARPRAPVAAFISQPYRGFGRAHAIWRRHVRPALPAAEFHVTATPERAQAVCADTIDCADDGLRFHGPLGKPALRDLLCRTRVLFYPGPKNETFCLAAAESLALGVPVVTLGRAGLGERVQHDVNGLVARRDAELGDAVRRVLSDDALWARLSAGAVASHRGYTWEAAAARWLELIAAWRPRHRA